MESESCAKTLDMDMAMEVDNSNKLEACPEAQDLKRALCLTGKSGDTLTEIPNDFWISLHVETLQAEAKAKAESIEPVQLPDFPVAKHMIPKNLMEGFRERMAYHRTKGPFTGFLLAHKGKAAYSKWWCCEKLLIPNQENGKLLLENEAV